MFQSVWHHLQSGFHGSLITRCGQSHAWGLQKKHLPNPSRTTICLVAQGTPLQKATQLVRGTEDFPWKDISYKNFLQILSSLLREHSQEFSEDLFHKKCTDWILVWTIITNFQLDQLDPVRWDILVNLAWLISAHILTLLNNFFEMEMFPMINWDISPDKGSRMNKVLLNQGKWPQLQLPAQLPCVIQKVTNLLQTVPTLPI